MGKHDGRDRHRQRVAEAALVEELAGVRAPLLREVERLAARPGYLRGQAAHACCRRPLNQMRISPLEARAIEQAFRRDPELRRRLPAVLDRVRRELADLRDSEDRQSFDCPLLEGTRCLVHDVAKPVGCTAWHPPAPGGDSSPYTRRGWKAFEQRDALNDRLYGTTWKLKVIPLWLARVFRRDLTRRRRSDRSGRRPASPGRGSGERSGRGSGDRGR